MAKVQFGLRSVYISKITETTDPQTGEVTISYGTPFALPGAVNLSLSPEGDENIFYADDTNYYTVSTNAGYSGSLEIAMITDKFATDILGYIKDQNELLAESKDVQPASFAMMFEVQSDAKARRYCFYNVKPGRAEVNANTIEESAEVQTATLDITAAAAKDTGYVKVSTTESTPDAAYNAWFTAVPTVTP